MTQKIKQVLLVEDDFGHAELIRRSFKVKISQMAVQVVRSLQEAQTAVSQSTPDLAIVDLLLPDGKGIEFLSMAGPNAPYPIIIMTSHGDEQIAVEAIKAGALDYVVKTEDTLLQMPYIADRALREWSHIQERKQTEGLLRVSEERFRQVISSISDHIYLMEITAEASIAYRYVSPNCETLTGYPPQAIMADANFWPSLIHPQDTNRVEAQQKLLAMGQNSEVEYRLIRKDGEIIWVRDSARVKQEGDAYLVYGVISDVTERKSIEDELRQYQDHLEELVGKRTEELAEAKEAAETANRAKSAFLANMSHELRTPLNAILGFSQLMERDTNISASQREYLDIISKSGVHLLGLINDVLELSKIEAGRTTLITTTFDLPVTLQNLTEMFRMTATKKGLTLDVEMDPNLPRYITTDEQKLRQVITNLVSNAIKFTEAGRVIVQARLNSRDDTTANLQFAVSDTGSGIADEDSAVLFEPFVQSGRGQSSQEGTGLGLPISRQFVHLMGGDFVVESQPGQGATFRFDIQAEISEPTAVILEESAGKVTGLVHNEESYRILIVEDNEYSRLLLRKLLESVGFQVAEAENGREAVAQYETWQPHLIWMDMRMPVMNGYEATRLIREKPRGKESFILALTASAFEEQRTNVIAAGCDDFVRKPFRENEIFEKMAEYLGVEYHYDDQQPSTTSDPGRPEDIFTPDTLAALPQPWLENLHDAAIRARADKITLLLSDIQSDYPQVAQHLAQLAEDFQFDKIITLTS
ncbi:MAG: response regulator [Chloroflexota bacterium]